MSLLPRFDVILSIPKKSITKKGHPLYSHILFGGMLFFMLLQIGCQFQDPSVDHVLLITMDTVRADALRCYDQPPEAANTEHLDQLAKEGTLFQRAVCQIPATLTSHTAILSGRMPRSTGVRFAKDRVPKSLDTVANIFHDNGYETAAFVSAAVLNRLYGLDQGFEVYDDLSDQPDNEAERSAENTTNLAIQWLEEKDSDQPFFLWVHYYDAHSPYHPEEEFDHYGPENYSGEVRGDSDQISRFVANEGKELSQEDLNRLRALYLGEVEYMDFHIGRLLQAFDNASNHQNLVVAISDHGENLGENGRFFHGADLYETCMHIPLIIRWPEEEYSGTRVEELVMGIDVMPTILAAAGLYGPMNVEGKDLKPFLTEQEEPEDRIALLETENEYRVDADKIFGAATLKEKLIDYRWHRRSPVLVGRSFQHEIDAPCFLRAWVRGDETVELVTHIRYHTEETFQSTDASIIENQPTILVRTSRYGLESIHQQYPVPEQEAHEGWTVIASPDLYKRALEYGRTQGWPTQHMMIESLAIDVGGIPGREKVDAYVDHIELVGEESFMVDDFEEADSPIYVDAGVGPEHFAASRKEEGQGLDGSIALRVASQYPKEEDIWERSEYYQYEDPAYPVETTNLLQEGLPVPMPDPLKRLADTIDVWLKQTPEQGFSTVEIDPQQEEQLRSLGYF